jgi:hypothetical protein
MPNPSQAATVDVKLTEDSDVSSYSASGFDKLLSELKDGKHWGAQLKLEKVKGEWAATRVIGLTFPQTHNGHPDGNDGKTYKYQADVGGKGASSEDRLWLKVSEMKITSSDYDAKKDRVTAKVSVKGALSMELKSHSGKKK